MTTDTEAPDGAAPSRTYRSRPDETPSETVVRAVASATGRSRYANEPGGGEPLDPLYESIDPDALDALFPDDSAAAGPVEFVYCGHAVTVDRTGAVTVAEL